MNLQELILAGCVKRRWAALCIPKTNMQEMEIDTVIIGEGEGVREFGISRSPGRKDSRWRYQVQLFFRFTEKKQVLHIPEVH